MRFCDGTTRVASCKSKSTRLDRVFSVVASKYIEGAEFRPPLQCARVRAAFLPSESLHVRSEKSPTHRGLGFECSAADSEDSMQAERATLFLSAEEFTAIREVSERKQVNRAGCGR
jgi:hypothetical protein